MEKLSQTSIFKNMYCQDCRGAEWQEVVNMITGGTLAGETDKYRYYAANGLDNSAQVIKKRMPAFTPAVICNGGRRPDNFVALTGVGMCDFDHVEDVDRARRLLTADAHAMMVYRTISGKGLRVLFRYRVKGAKDDDKADARSMADIYNVAFKTGNEYFARLLGCEADGQCKNIGRLSIMCHDGEAAINPGCEPLEIELHCERKPAKGADGKKHHAPLQRAVRAIEAKLEREGVEYRKGTYNKYVARTGYYLNKLGVDADDALKWAVERFNDYDAACVTAIMKSCYSHTDEHASMRVQAMGAGRAKPAARGVDVTAIEDFLKSRARFRYNVITRKTEYKTDANERWLEVSDRFENSLWSEMNKAGLHVRNIELHNVIMSDFVAEWNPFKEYFDNLPAWDGKTDYIGRLTSMVHVKKGDLWDDTDNPQELFDMCFRKWLVGMVASLLDKDVVNNAIIVLIGRQGIYKTTFFNYLLPEELRPYFHTKTNSDTMTKDDRLSLAEYAIICLEEIDSMRTPELNQLKALVTTRTINERAAYSRYKENRTHIASFCGTGNNLQFLTDPTGNRRWLPFEADYIDDPRTVDYNYDGIYSQALALWRSGMAYWFNNSEISTMARHIKSFEVPNVEEELIVTYYRQPEGNEAYKLVNATNIIEHINIFIKRALSTVKVGAAMRKLGFKQKATKHGRMYIVVERKNGNNS